MGLFAGRTARFDHARIAEQMRPTVAAFFNARIQIFDPALAAITTDFDPLADTGGRAAPPAPLYDSGPNGAELQPIRSPIAVQFGDQTTFILGIRFQLVRPPEALALRAGLRIRVLDGGNVPELESYQYTINEGFDTSIGWTKIIEATTATSGVS